MDRLTGSEWASVLAKKPRPSPERVIVTSTSRKVLTIKKEQWQRHFAGFGGIEFSEGREIRIVPATDGGPKATLPPWVVEGLAPGDDDAVCVTERDGQRFLK